MIQKLLMYTFFVLLLPGFVGGLDHRKKIEQASAHLILRTEKILDTLVIHNYDHGGIGFTLSWGSAQKAVEMMELAANKKLGGEARHVAIVGAGVIGLTTAHVLLDRGYTVHLYAKSFPPHVTSSFAEGVWTPCADAIGMSKSNKEYFQEMIAISLQKFQQLALSDHPELGGLSLLPVSVDKATDTTFLVPLKGEGKSDDTYATILIDGKYYMQDLFDSARAKGMITSSASFSSLQDLSLLAEKTVFNCMGYGMADLHPENVVIKSPMETEKTSQCNVSRGKNNNLIER